MNTAEQRVELDVVDKVWRLSCKQRADIRSHDNLDTGFCEKFEAIGASSDKISKVYENFLGTIAAAEGKLMTEFCTRRWIILPLTDLGTIGGPSIGTHRG